MFAKIFFLIKQQIKVFLSAYELSIFQSELSLEIQYIMDTQTKLFHFQQKCTLIPSLTKTTSTCQHTASLGETNQPACISCSWNFGPEFEHILEKQFCNFTSQQPIWFLKEYSYKNCTQNCVIQEFNYVKMCY